jgi:hypothetical protein
VQWRYWLVRSGRHGVYVVGGVSAALYLFPSEVLLKAGPFSSREEAEAARRRWEES